MRPARFPMAILALVAFAAVPLSTGDGNDSTGRAAHARRARLLGTIDLYEIALYVDGPVRPANLASPDVMKAVRLDVTYVEDLHRRVRLDWQRELIPNLVPAARARLRSAFAPLRQGDYVLI